MENKTTLSDPHYERIQHKLIKSSKNTAIRQINALMTATYREIGRRSVEAE